MLNVRALLIVAAAFAAACTPPAATTTAGEDASQRAPADATTQALLAVLTPVVTQEIGAPVRLDTTTMNVRDEWAYVVAEPRNIDGSAIDWTATNLASRWENAVMDESGTVHALLKLENGGWTLLEHVIAPTDVAWIDWASRHGVPPDILGLPSN